MKIKFKKLHKDAVLPTHSKQGDAGADLTVVRIGNINNYRQKHYYGIAVEIPENHVGLLFPRSSVHKYNARLSNSVGVIDSGFRGEVCAVFNEYSAILEEYKVGDRTAQLVIVPYISIKSEWSDSLSETDRGTGGYGHTGN